MNCGWTGNFGNYYFILLFLLFYFAWIFFENTYPCFKSRAIILEIIRKTFGYSDFAKEISFDRLFPNQDTIVDGGFGNLIALPLQGERVSHNTSVFCDVETFTPHINQWEFLQTIHKHSIDELDSVHDIFFERKDTDSEGVILNNKGGAIRAPLLLV